MVVCTSLLRHSRQSRYGNLKECLSSLTFQPPKRRRSVVLFLALCGKPSLHYFYSFYHWPYFTILQFYFYCNYPVYVKCHLLKLLILMEIFWWYTQQTYNSVKLFQTTSSEERWHAHAVLQQKIHELNTVLYQRLKHSTFQRRNLRNNNTADLKTRTESFKRKAGIYIEQNFTGKTTIARGDRRIQFKPPIYDLPWKFRIWRCQLDSISKRGWVDVMEKHCDLCEKRKKHTFKRNISQIFLYLN